MLQYHDEEWGVESRDPRHLFEMVCLEGAQAGLSWNTILNKRQAYKRVFHNFDEHRLASMGEDDVIAIISDPSCGIVRNKAKVRSVFSNARALLKMQKEGIEFDEFLWSFAPKTERGTSPMPTSTEESKQMSAALKRAGFKFVGPTICYALMQAVGIVNDHEVSQQLWEHNPNPTSPGSHIVSSVWLVRELKIDFE